jgi:hypothetical protein
MNFIVLAKQWIKVNWSTMVFNDLYNKLRNLSANRDNIEFNATQVVDILFQNGFLVDLTFIVLDLEEDYEGITKPTLEA